ncbi:hypothetical protein EU527_08040 [Candidatus Thorarchaeota archaeon]|nr:MAG: hypothetical protein EU527_08040 [Candidatus Thorarchaeota archaeon]
MIILLTDFGESEYVGVMKGVILSIDSNARIIDLTHSISPQSVREAAWVLLKSYRYFPKNSIFVCVVDPGVGTSRDAVLVETSEYIFIGPDNGLLFPTLTELSSYKAYSITINPTVSSTFHGRDVFAVAAGRYHRGTSAEELGIPLNSLSVPLVFHYQENSGEVVRIDHFGNIVTNIPPTSKNHFWLSVNEKIREISLYTTYAEGPDTGIFAIIGSAGTIEFSAKNQSAIDYLAVEIGDLVTLEEKSSK